jgi:hypothetical protein
MAALDSLNVASIDKQRSHILSAWMLDQDRSGKMRSRLLAPIHLERQSAELLNVLPAAETLCWGR